MAGPKLTMAHTTAALSATSVLALARNPAREYALFINDGAEAVYLFIGGTAIGNQGIRVNANGGNYEMSRLLGNLSHDVINGITLSGAVTLLVTEGV